MTEFILGVSIGFVVSFGLALAVGSRCYKKGKEDQAKAMREAERPLYKGLSRNGDVNRTL